ncbi:carbohydrate esterase family 4 protein [Phanerochaete carnosa HHB-10118-sp]|uniref:chitin deacetylase n=1 Tax=Phanerochaete carnosa (strain HHB-10118-sp) TaxID=650164 RepID=K5WIV9_PHACS|nr:carbohydrate esterase family 4 protein [Phanerochaete carnosa HHB-10118-sp]EKM59059.1 carbohydrate esterase family 4 protein [Phanerochaete carnosa HHB-10118-sp]
MLRSTPRSLPSLLALLALSNLVLSASLPAGQAHDHAPLRKRLPGTWYQPGDHPAHALFRRGKRDTSNDGVDYPPVGSSQWSAGYPQGKPDPTEYPQEWLNALNAAVAAGNIPNVPVSTQVNGGNPTYGSLDPTGNEVCSTTYGCRNNDDIWDAPDGVWAAGFDDGPLPTSDKLYQFLQQNNVRSTHFMIGVNILGNPNEFSFAFETLGDDIAVHTWTHPYMTTLSNEQLVGEFGWTMEIIHNSTGGHLPKYWRPPYGDSDNRVSAIAKEVFGLQTIIWNHDTEDWSIDQPGYSTTPESVNASLTQWITGPKSPGLIVLEHELTEFTVQAFIDAFPLIKSSGWDIVSVTELDGESAYANADGDDGEVTPVSGIFLNAPAAAASNASASASGVNFGSSSAATSSSASPSQSAGSSGGAAGAGGAKQAVGSAGSSSSSIHAAAAPTGTNLASGATSVHWQHVLGDVPGMLAAMFTVLVSAVVFA